jgi:hypothetical protein
MVRGQVRADGIVVAGLQVDLTKLPNVFTAEAKLVNSTSGQTVATIMIGGWTPEVLTKLRELIDVMEQSIGREVFADSHTQDGQPPEQRNISNQGMTGLGEFLGGEDAPPV